MAFRGLVCVACGDTAQPDYTYRRMIGVVGDNIFIHDDCCLRIHQALSEIAEGQNALTERFRITAEHWPSTM